MKIKGNHYIGISIFRHYYLSHFLFSWYSMFKFFTSFRRKPESSGFDRFLDSGSPLRYARNDEPFICPSSKKLEHRVIAVYCLGWYSRRDIIQYLPTRRNSHVILFLILLFLFLFLYRFRRFLFYILFRIFSFWHDVLLIGYQQTKRSLRPV